VGCFTFDHLTPPSTATMRGYAIWLQESIIGPFPNTQVDAEDGVIQSEHSTSLEMWNCCQENLQFKERDLQSIVTLSELINQMVASSFSARPL
jgi:hypothetical protein